MFTVFIVIQILLTLALVGLILVQRNDSDGLGSMGGGGGGNAFMTGRGAANFMTRSTAIVATLFMLNSLWLAIMASNIAGGSSLAEEIGNSAEPTQTIVPLADEPVATDPKPLTPEMPVITTEEPSGDPVTAEPQAEETTPAPETSMETDVQENSAEVPTP
jgi:preprotein translocase subunit SecG